MPTDLITTEDVAARFHVTPQTVRWWRSRGLGPKSFRAGGKRVLYRVIDVNSWESEQYQKSNPET